MSEQISRPRDLSNSYLGYRDSFAALYIATDFQSNSWGLKSIDFEKSGIGNCVFHQLCLIIIKSKKTPDCVV